MIKINDSKRITELLRKQEKNIEFTTKDIEFIHELKRVIGLSANLKISGFIVINTTNKGHI